MAVGQKGAAVLVLLNKDSCRAQQIQAISIIVPCQSILLYQASAASTMSMLLFSPLGRIIASCHSASAMLLA